MKINDDIELGLVVLYHKKSGHSCYVSITIDGTHETLLSKEELLSMIEDIDEQEEIYSKTDEPCDWVRKRICFYTGD